jgi:hypothetical protein
MRYTTAVKLFISHSSADRAFAEKLAATLEEGGHKVWTDRELMPGDNFMRAIGTALDEADVVVALVSAHALKSEYVKREWEYALGQERFAGRLIPVVIDEQSASRMPWILEKLSVPGPSVKRAAQQVMSLLQKPRPRSGQRAAR